MPPKSKAAPLDPVAQRAHLDAILAAPDDNAPRLAYADWLLRHADERGNLILMQLEAHRSAAAAEQAAKLEKQHGAKWARPVKALGKLAKWRFRRGMIDRLVLDAWSPTCTPQAVGEILACEPVTELRLNGDDERIAALLDVPGIERVRRLVVHAGPSCALPVARATRLGGLRELRIGVTIGDAGVDALAGARLDSLVHLALGMPRASADALARLAASPLGQRLESFEWCRDTVTPAHAEALAAMGRLRTFVASLRYYEQARPTLTARFGDALVEENEPGMTYLEDGVTGASREVERSGPA